MRNLRSVFQQVQEGNVAYIVGLRHPKSRSELYEGAWIDEHGRVHVEYSIVVYDKREAGRTGIEEHQQVILVLLPAVNSQEYLYLVHDNPVNRSIAIREAGGYTADGEYLLVYTPKPILFTEQIDVIECRGYFVEPETLL